MKTLYSISDDDIIARCTSYSNGFYEILSELQIDDYELRDLLLDYNIEQCDTCKLFTDSHHLVGPDNEVDGYCDNCRAYEMKL